MYYLKALQKFLDTGFKNAVDYGTEFGIVRQVELLSNGEYRIHSHSDNLQQFLGLVLEIPILSAENWHPIPSMRNYEDAIAEIKFQFEEAIITVEGYTDECMLQGQI